MSRPHERRQFWRAQFSSPVQLVLYEQAAEACLLDISLGGALVEAPEGWGGDVGDRCQMLLDLGAQATIDMSATVRHISGRRVGLHADAIDLDGMAHLRCLVRLNAGDTYLLDHELSALLRKRRSL